MKRTRSEGAKPKTGIQWDEANLEENDKIKQEINPHKINEPKTPYHGPMEEEPGYGEPGMSPLRLEEEVTTALHSGHTYHEAHPKPDEHADVQSRSEGLIAEEGAYRASSCQSGDSMHSTCSSDDGRAHFTDGQEADGVSSTAGSGDKRRRFANKRKDHYDMRSALKEPQPLNFEGCSHCTQCRGKELVTKLYHTNNEDEQQNGTEHHQPFQPDAEDSS